MSDDVTSDDEAPEHATSVGQTGGLPGDNAHWRTSRVPEDELASTVQRGDVAPASEPPAPVDDADDVVGSAEGEPATDRD